MGEKQIEVDKLAVPNRSLVLDWVFADGPPRLATLYDNNQHKAKRRRNSYQGGENSTYESRTKERTTKSFLLSQKDIVYTDPLDVQAGGLVTVFYNPLNTVLNGKPEIWFRCSFTCWTPPRMGLLPPQQMSPADNGTHAITSGNPTRPDPCVLTRIELLPSDKIKGQKLFNHNHKQEDKLDEQFEIGKTNASKYPSIKPQSRRTIQNFGSKNKQPNGPVQSTGAH